MSSRALFWLFCAALFAFAAGDRALALERSTVTAIGSNHLVVTTGGRKGTRVYTPDELADYEALVEGQEKVTATHDATSQEKLESDAWRAGTAQLTSRSQIGEKSASGNFQTEVCDGPVGQRQCSTISQPIAGSFTAASSNTPRTALQVARTRASTMYGCAGSSRRVSNNSCSLRTPTTVFDGPIRSSMGTVPGPRSGLGNFVTDIHASLLPLPAGLPFCRRTPAVLGTFINKLDASAFKGASDLIQC